MSRNTHDKERKGNRVSSHGPVVRAGDRETLTALDQTSRGLSPLRLGSFQTSTEQATVVSPAWRGRRAKNAPGVGSATADTQHPLGNPGITSFLSCNPGTGTMRTFTE